MKKDATDMMSYSKKTNAGKGSGMTYMPNPKQGPPMYGKGLTPKAPSAPKMVGGAKKPLKKLKSYGFAKKGM